MDVCELGMQIATLTNLNNIHHTIHFMARSDVYIYTRMQFL